MARLKWLKIMSRKGAKTQRGIMVENELTKRGVGWCLKIHRILEPGLLELVKALLCVFAPLREILTICKTILFLVLARPGYAYRFRL
jgi:hypothetical protein